MIREKKIRSGKLLEVSYYPVTKTGQAVSRGSPAKLTSEAQEKYNQKQRQKRTVRLVCANFDNSDIFLTLTFKPSEAPADMKDAKRILSNFLRRVKRLRERKAESLKKDKARKEDFKKASASFKYLYALESKVYKKGVRKGKKNFHFHLFISGAGTGDRDEYEKIWSGIAVAKRYEPDKYGIDSAAKYITKEKVQSTAPGERCIGCSRNLTKPKETVKDGKLTEGGLARIAKCRMTDAGYWERKNKNYTFVSGKAVYNNLNGKWYVSVLMYRDKESPPIDVDYWLKDDEYDRGTGAAEVIQLGNACSGTVP